MTREGLFKLRVPTAQLSEWARRYYDFYDDSEVIAIGGAARTSGYLTGDQFRSLARWKTVRTQSRCQRNSEPYVRQVTRAALGSSEPRFKIEVLRLLDGVDWPTASVILHFCDTERWPIMDYRAFWSLGQASPAGRYSYDLWSDYAEATRRLADELGVEMRTLDQALWAYSKVKQR